MVVDTSVVNSSYIVPTKTMCIIYKFSELAEIKNTYANTFIAVQYAIYYTYSSYVNAISFKRVLRYRAPIYTLVSCTGNNRPENCLLFRLHCALLTLPLQFETETLKQFTHKCLIIKGLHFGAVY